MRSYLLFQNVLLISQPYALHAHQHSPTRRHQIKTHLFPVRATLNMCYCAPLFVNFEGTEHNQYHNDAI